MKKCSVCEKDFPTMWKAKTKDHGQMCRYCWASFRSSESEDHSKVVSKVNSQKKRSPIAPISEKKAKELVLYRKERDEYMKEHPICEVKGCGNRSDDLHHKKPRAYHLLDVSVYMAVCRSCHQKIEREDNWARKNGYKINHLQNQKM